MAHMDRVHEDAKIEAMRKASMAMTIGALFLVMAGMAGIFFFQTLRSGTEMWRDFFFAQAAIGIVLTGWGFWGRRRYS